MKKSFSFGSIAFLAALLTFATTRSEASTVYYLRPAANSGFQLARIDADGSNDQVINTGLPVPSFPSWSKDGAILALTSVNPQRPSKISEDVFTYDVVSGGSRLVVPFEDITTVEPVVQGGVVVGSQNRFSYTLPLYKAVSPNHERIAVASLVTSGFYQTQQPPALDSLSGVTQTPLLQIYSMADGGPQEIISLGRVRSFYTLGGFGVDWHPTLNLLVAPIDGDAPTIGSTQPSESSAIYLIEAIPSAISTGHARQLTHPQGSVQYTATGATFSVQTDYAPVFSPDGGTVAYLHAINTVDSGGGVTLHRPISIAIRAVNTDGSSDHLILQLASGIFPTQVSWSPDGSQLVFDTGLQPAPEPQKLAQLQARPETLQLSIVNANGSNPHPLHGVGAGIPSWRPGSATGASPQLDIHLQQGSSANLLISWPLSAQNFTLESSPTLATAANWQGVQGSIISVGGQNTVSIPAQAGTRFFRLRSL